MDRFIIDKRASLNIMREILSHIGKNDICVGKNFDIDRQYCDDDPYIDNIIPFRHNLCVAETYAGFIELDNISDQIEIYYYSEIIGDKINLVAYLHDTQSECDISYPSFTYNRECKMWIIDDDDWDETVLDFSKYKLINLIVNFDNNASCKFLQPINELL